MPPTSFPPKVQIEISADPIFVDEEVRIRVQGLPPDALALIRARAKDDADREWTSAAEFRADASGCVDLAKQPSLRGSYRGVSSSGLFWSMTLPVERIGMQAGFVKTSAASHEVLIEVMLEGAIAATRSVERRFFAPGTQTRELKIDKADGTGDESTVGKLFLPPSSGHSTKPPAVIVLSGSGGGFDVDKAAVLSRHGFATLALAYFGIPPLPSWLHRVPLEYFESALQWLTAQPEIDAERIAVLAVSRGAELGLLLGTKFREIRAIVGYAPSALAWAAGGPDKTTGELVPTWTWRGAAVPFAPLPLRSFMLRSAIPVVALKRPVMFRNLFRAGLRGGRSVAEAAISVEQIAAPILLFSGGDDHLWPAAEMCEAIVRRRRAHAREFATEHVHYPRAGHNLRYPHLPTTLRHGRNPHLRGARFSFGGNPQADAEAQADAWIRAIAFLRAHL